MFQHYEWAITFGSFFTIVIAGLVIFEIFGRPVFTDFAEQPRVAKFIITWLAIILTITGLAVVIGLGLIRFRLINPLPPSLDSSVVKYDDVVITILIPANVILSTRWLLERA